MSDAYSEIGISIIIPSAGLFRVVLKEPANCWVFSGFFTF
jgi:hypothetical protein